MPVSVNGLDLLGPTEFIDVLKAMISKMKLFQSGMQEIADKTIKDFTNTDLLNIPVHLSKAQEFKKVIGILEEVAILKLTKMSYDQALSVVEIQKNMRSKEKELDALVKRFQDWDIASCNF